MIWNDFNVWTEYDVTEFTCTEWWEYHDMNQSICSFHINKEKVLHTCKWNYIENNKRLYCVDYWHKYDITILQEQKFYC